MKNVKPPYTQKAFPGAACVPKAKLASTARLMRVMKNTLIRPAGTFPQGKVKGVLLDWWFEKRKPPYSQKAFPGAACVPKAKLASVARLMRVM